MGGFLVAYGWIDGNWYSATFVTKENKEKFIYYLLNELGAIQIDDWYELKNANSVTLASNYARSSAEGQTFTWSGFTS